MPKIYLSPAYHKWNPCALDGCDETTHNNLYLDELEKYLKACKIDYKRGPRRVPKSTEDSNSYLSRAVKESNEYGADIHYISHTNAFDGEAKGYRPIIYPGYKEAKRLADIMIKKRKEIYPHPVTLNTRTDLYELYATKATAYYEEHVFHDNKEDALWFHDNMNSIAKSTAMAFCEYFGIPFVEVKDEENKSKTVIDLLYKVIAILKDIFKM